MSYVLNKLHCSYTQELRLFFLVGTKPVSNGSSGKCHQPLIDQIHK